VQITVFLFFGFYALNIYEINSEHQSNRMIKIKKNKKVFCSPVSLNKMSCESIL